jgi:amino acid transporter
MAEDNIPSPAVNLIYFIVVSIIFLFFTIFNIFNSDSLETINNNISNNSVNIIYILFLVLGTYFINVNNSKAMCLSTSINWTKVLFITILPWIIIFAILYFLLEIFPGWVSPFANTLGYFFISFLGAKDVITELLSSKDKIRKNENLVSAINNIEKNKEKFINQIEINNNDYIDFITQMKTEGLLNSEIDSVKLNENKTVLQLYKLINIKFIVGKVFWYILAGILISSISYNYIINIQCSKSVEETKKRVDAIMDADLKDIDPSE